MNALTYSSDRLMVVRTDRDVDYGDGHMAGLDAVGSGCGDTDGTGWGYGWGSGFCFDAGNSEGGGDCNGKGYDNGCGNG